MEPLAWGWPGHSFSHPPCSSPHSLCLLQARLDGGRQQWRPVLMAVTEKDLLLYDGMPWTRDAWASPCHSYPLVATRWAGRARSIHPHPLGPVPWLCFLLEQRTDTETLVGMVQHRPDAAIVPLTLCSPPPPGWCIRARASARPPWAQSSPLPPGRALARVWRCTCSVWRPTGTSPPGHASWSRAATLPLS